MGAGQWGRRLVRAVVQRVGRARVLVDGAVVGKIGRGLCVLVCAMKGDGEEDAQFLARKLASLRIFPCERGKMNLDVRDVSGGVLLVSQFTLAADTTSGSRPSFSAAMEASGAQALLSALASRLKDAGLPVESGRFGTKMDLELVNDGPVTIYLDSRAKTRN